MLEDLDTIAWESKPQPEWNSPKAVSAAIRAIAVVRSQEAAAEAYGAFLYAIGNNHRGSYYPVVLDTIPFIGRILNSNNPWARRAVLDVVVDLIGSFGPEAGYESVESSSGRSVCLRDALRDSISALSPVLEALSGDASQPSRVQELAQDALDLLADPRP